MSRTPLSKLPYLEWTEPDTGEVVRFYADATKDEEPDLPAVATSHPVETGAPITDHYRKDPENFKVALFLSGSPLRGDLDPDNPGDLSTFPLKIPPYPPGASLFTPGGATQAVGGLISAGLGALGLGPPPPPTSFDALSFDDPPKNRAAAFLETVRRLQTNGVLVAVGSTLGRVENMAIMSCAAHRSADTGDGTDFELSLQELRFVTSDVTLGLPLPVEPRGQPKKTGANSGDGEALDGQQSTVAAGIANSAGFTGSGR